VTDQRFVLPNDLAPGQSVTLNVAVTAPSTSGNYVLEYEMVQENVAWFAQYLDSNVSVPPALSASYAPSGQPSAFAAGATVTYSVAVTNNGTVNWPAGGSTPVHLGIHFATKGGGYSANASSWVTNQRFSLPNDLAPGQSATLNVTVTAPTTTGSYVLEYEMVQEGVAWFAQYLDSTVSVAAPSGASYATSGQPSTFTGGATVSYSVTVTNNGSVAWPAGGSNPVHLGIHFATKGGGYSVNASSWVTDQRYSLPSDLAPGQSVTLNVAVTAPTTSGSYVLEYEMVQEGVAWFAQFLDSNVSVPPALSATYAPSGQPSAFAAGSTASYSVTVTNNGTSTWPAGGIIPVHLGIHFATKGGGYAANASSWVSDQRFVLLNDVAPGQSVTLNVAATAPTTSGNYVLEYEMVQEGVAWFAQYLDGNVSVT
jgi:DNA gyrase inhibitor GyrI